MRAVEPDHRSERGDYRSSPMDSLEGYGIARSRYQAFHLAIPNEVHQEIAERRIDAGLEPDLGWRHSVFPEVNKVMAQHLKEESELIGFYVAWHTYGGFDKLEQAGWHRATIHRKIRRFRDRYGKHPDEYRFSWMKLNLEQHWNEEIDHDLTGPLGEP
jgi:hypothetical protein